MSPIEGGASLLTLESCFSTSLTFVPDNPNHGFLLETRQPIQLEMKDGGNTWAPHSVPSAEDKYVVAIRSFHRYYYDLLATRQRTRFQVSLGPFTNLCCIAANALLKLRQRIMSDLFGALSNWVDYEASVDPCNWFGAECSDGRVMVLNLNDPCLGGTLALELVTLVNIKSM